MKLLLSLACILLLTMSASKCGSKKTAAADGVYKGRLETKALCMNYTLTVLEGAIDTSLVATKWTDENTGKTFTNAFALATPCSFPATLQQGDEFYFVIDSTIKEQCAVCMAFYPTPPKKLSIKVVEKK